MDPRPELSAVLGSTLVRAMGDEPASLKAAWKAWQALAASDGDDTARTWFIGGNTLLSEDTPITAVREGRLEEFAAAISSQLEGGHVA